MYTNHNLAPFDRNDFFFAEAFELFEDEYGKEGNESFYKVVDTYTSDRSDDALQQLVLKLFDTILH